MLLQSEYQEVEIQGADESSTNFSIAMNAKAFKVLSSTLYKNKIGSIVREISTNALDAHIMQGNPDEPFVIHLPNEFEPWFSVQDFGIGLSPEGVKELYSKYFASSKDQSNDCTGMLGLGSKTPFSYTDQFTITSNFNGRKYFFSAYLSGLGIPSVQLMHSQETADRNGVEIKISVQKEDYTKFVQEAKNQLKFFEVKPIVENAPYNFEFDKVFEKDGIVSATNFKLFDPRTSGITDSYIIQGPIGYPFDFCEFTSKCKDLDAISIARKFNAVGRFCLVFPIGSIGVTASREDMEYTDHTVKNIADALIAVYAEIQKSFLSKVATSASNWEIARISNETDMFGDKEIYKQAFQSKSAKPDLFRNVFSFAIDPLKFTATQYSQWRRKNTGDTLPAIPAAGSNEIYILDDCKYQKQRLNTLKGSANFIAIKIREGSTRAELVHTLGGFDNFKNISDIAYAPSPRGKGSRTKTQCWKCMGDVDVRKWSKVKAEDAPEGAEVVYVLVQDLAMKDTQDYCSRIQIWRELHIQGFDAPDLYGIRALDEESFKENNPDAKSLKDYLDEKKLELHSEMQKQVKYNEWKNATHLELSSDMIEALKENKDSTIARLLNLHEKIASKVNTRMLNLAKPFGYFKSDSTFGATLLKIAEGEVQKRPILRLNSWELTRKLNKEELKAYLSLRF